MNNFYLILILYMTTPNRESNALIFSIYILNLIPIFLWPNHLREYKKNKIKKLHPKAYASNIPSGLISA